MKTTMYASRRQVLAGGIAAAALATLAACGSDKKDTSPRAGLTPRAALAPRAAARS